jgi:hypothetical protein
MLDFMAEQQCQSVGINPPHERSDAEQRSLVRNQLQLHRGPSLQQCFRSDFRTMRADVHGTCHVSVRPCLDENRPRHAGSRMVPSVLLSWNRHERSITAIRVPKRGSSHGPDFRLGSPGSWLSGEEEQLRHFHHSLLFETTSSFPRVNTFPTLSSVSHCQKHLERYAFQNSRFPFSRCEGKLCEASR